MSSRICEDRGLFSQATSPVFDLAAKLKFHIEFICVEVDGAIQVMDKYLCVDEFRSHRIFQYLYDELKKRELLLRFHINREQL